MRYKHGDNLIFEEGECSLDSQEAKLTYTARGEPFRIEYTNKCSGEIIPPSSYSTADARQAYIQQRMNTIRANLVSGEIDSGLLNNNGSYTENMLVSTASIGGIRVTSPLSFAKKDQAEGLSGRTFSFAVSAEVRASFTGIFDYRQTITYEGNTGPEYVAIPLDVGPPVLQQVREQGIQRITQSGMAVGIDYYPGPVYYAAAFPLLPLGGPPVYTEESPIYRNGLPTLYPISWRWSFVSADQKITG